MTFDQAAAFVMPVGPHAGKTLGDIAATDEGLLELDEMLLMEDLATEEPTGDVEEALRVYLGDETAAERIDALTSRMFVH